MRVRIIVVRKAHPTDGANEIQFWHNHLIQYVDHSVVGFNVLLNDVNTVDLGVHMEVPFVGVYFNILILNRLLPSEMIDFAAHVFSIDDVVE